jgi:hypothetical protein
MCGSPEEAVMLRAVSDAMKFAADSKRHNVERLWHDARAKLSETLGFDVDEEFISMWRKVFSATLEALVDWDFATNFEHAPTSARDV